MKDFEILKKARRAGLNEEGYVVRYDGELLFIYRPDEGHEIESCTFWTLDIERHWCIEEFDPDFYNYYEAEGFMRPLKIEG